MTDYCCSKKDQCYIELLAMLYDFNDKITSKEIVIMEEYLGIEIAMVIMSVKIKFQKYKRAIDS